MSTHDQWVIDMESDLREGRLDGDQHVPHEEMAPIFRVQNNVRGMNEEAYKPKVVSIGPYHHFEERLQAMEEHKRRALLHFLKRSNQQTPTECLDLLRRALNDIRGAYDNLDEIWRNDEELFLKMMLMDGCFIIEILLAYSGSTVKDYDKDDPIFGHRGQLYMNVPSIRRDLLLIENQIPLLVLQKLFSRAKMKGLVGILLKFLSDSRANVRSLHRIFSGDDQKQRLHILDLYRRILIFDDEDVGSGCKFKKLNATKIPIPSAMALQDQGILMRRHSGPARFSRRDQLWKLFGGPKLKLPGLTVDDATESVFLNAMAFESRRPEADARFTSYVDLMNGLIVYPKDAKLLSTQLGIIRNELGSDQALVDLFRRLPSPNFLPDCWFYLLQRSIYEHCRS